MKNKGYKKEIISGYHNIFYCANTTNRFKLRWTASCTIWRLRGR
jgi:hypothetical protein